MSGAVTVAKKFGWGNNVKNINIKNANIKKINVKNSRRITSKIELKICSSYYINKYVSTKMLISGSGHVQGPNHTLT